MNRNLEIECAIWKEKFSNESEINVILNAQLQDLSRQVEQLQKEIELAKEESGTDEQSI